MNGVTAVPDFDAGDQRRVGSLKTFFSIDAISTSSR